MKLRRIATLATLASVAAISVPALAYQVIVPTQDEKGYVARWDPTIQGKTRMQVKTELAQARAEQPNAVRFGVFPTPRSSVVADSATVQRGARDAMRQPVDRQYWPQ